MSDNNFNSAHLMLAFLGGAATGAAVAYLTAPKSGADTRQWLSDSLAVQRDEIAKMPPRFRAAYKAALDAAKAEYNKEALEAAVGEEE